MKKFGNGTLTIYNKEGEIMDQYEVYVEREEGRIYWQRISPCNEEFWKGIEYFDFQVLEENENEIKGILEVWRIDHYEIYDFSIYVYEEAIIV